MPTDIDKTTLFGLWVSKDRGETWEQNNVMKKVSVTGLDISHDKKYVYAATRGAGLWRIPVDCKYSQVSERLLPVKINPKKSWLAGY